MLSGQHLESFAKPAPNSSFENDLLARLEQAGGLSSENAERARRAHGRAGGSLVNILIRLGLCEEKILASHISAMTGISLFDVEDFPPAAIRLRDLSVPFLREAHVLPLAESDEFVRVAIVDPSDTYTVQALRLMFAKPVQLCIATANQIEDGILRLYAEVLGSSVSEVMDLAAGDVTDTDLVRLRESASEAPIVRFVERLVAKAVDAGASDIHIEPFERHLRVRLRIDGILTEEDAAPLSSAAAIVSRIKILARLDIAERRLPQDGAIKMNVRGKEVDLRVATTPVVHGEEIVIRILDQSAVQLDMNVLGFSDQMLAALNQILDRPNGILLVTGPTGSGKSTTLYAALTRLNRMDRKIITVEDPVEYKIDGLNQIQVKPEIGLDFARSLRSILRHDPDIIMVGEIRDSETARIATQAALTGHLVLSTLHTNDAASAITRLLDMGIEKFLIASTVSGVLAQRLVRTLCRECREPTESPPILREQIAARAARGEAHQLYKAVGCPNCRGTGYRGRTVIAEFMALDGALRRQVLVSADAVQLRTTAVSEGMQTLYENGLICAMRGVTSYDEVVRMAQDMEGGG